jgi:hypothetical protein
MSSESTVKLIAEPNVATSKLKVDTNFEYEKMEKFAVDLHFAKEDSEENLTPGSFTRWGLFDNEWIQVPDELRNSEEFKQYMIENFEDEPIIEEEADLQIFLRKTKQEIDEEDQSSESMDGDEVDGDEEMSKVSFKS